MKRNRFTLFILLIGALGLLLGSAQPAAAQTPTPRSVSDDEVNAVAHNLYCPVCENIPLDVCGTKACEQWRELIRQKLAAGWDEAAIQDYFALNYGDRVLSEPPREGLHWLVYLLPPLFILGGAVLLWRLLRKGRKPIQTKADDSPSQTQDQYAAQIENELRQRQKHD